MRAVGLTGYGSADVLHIREAEKPAPGVGEVLISVQASTVTPPDSAFRTGKPLLVRLFAGLRRPKSIPGSELAGVVEDVGQGVTRLAIGDRVYGTAAPDSGAHAEYRCLPEDGVLATLPEGMSFEEAVAIIDGGLTALPFLRDVAKLRRGQAILVIGASGSVGGAAVQLAKYFGATVTGVCSTRNVELVRSLGADHVVDYTAVDFTTSSQTYDVVFDAVGKSSFSRCRKTLTRDGIYMTTVPSLGIMIQTLMTRMGRRRATIAFTGLTTNRERLMFLDARARAGELRPVVDRVYRLEEIADAHRYVDTQRKRGSVVLRVTADASADMKLTDHDDGGPTP